MILLPSLPDKYPRKGGHGGSPDVEAGEMHQHNFGFLFPLFFFKDYTFFETVRAGAMERRRHSARACQHLAKDASEEKSYI